MMAVERIASQVFSLAIGVAPWNREGSSTTAATNAVAGTIGISTAMSG